MVVTFSIAEISKRTGLNYDTIRYYIKIGLLPPAEKKKNGKREYSEVHLERLLFIRHLKRTQMPLKEIERYLTLASERNYKSCFDILHEQKHKIELQIKELQETLDVVSDKLDRYQDVVKRTEISRFTKDIE
ncbi:MerR family transcriptional regulator [Pullulanibacillus sp. KACC 23026]|uniref:MerR family transcriptional regulator n=1 Tax=Pullulanibacillus sp. KACC 23026 TaxID=3028315 RepID=UPI0023B10DEF|nr:MerR family transcriptional regulator [Pullulanibacillus sp. KACC 23026]WEG14477.1 MerR family transcriptional regulator [Pullulanibacillus sp. KACC 23026]